MNTHYSSFDVPKRVEKYEFESKWVSFGFDDHTVDIFISEMNYRAWKDVGMKLVELATTLERDELARVETLAAARHAVAKTTPSPDMITDFGMVEHKTYVLDEDDIPF